MPAARVTPAARLRLLLGRVVPPQGAAVRGYRWQRELLAAASLLLGLLVVPGPARAQGLTPGDIYVADPSAAGGRGAVIRVNPLTGQQTLVSAGGLFVDPVAIALEPSGSLVVVDPNALDGRGAVIRVNPLTGQQTLVSAGQYFEDPLGITIAPNGDLYVANASCSCLPPGVLRVDPTTGVQTPVSLDDQFITPAGLTNDGHGTLYVADAGLFVLFGRVIRVNAATGAQTIVARGGNLAGPTDVTIGPGGDLFVADPMAAAGDGAIIRINPATGQQTVVSAGGLLGDPVGIAVGLDGNLLVADAQAVGEPPGCGCGGAILRVDPRSGAQSLLTRGGLLVSPTGLTVVPVSPPTPTATPTSTSTNTPTPTSAATATPLPTTLPSPTATGTASATATPTPTVPSATPTSAPTSSATPSPSVTGTPSLTATRTPTATPTVSPRATFHAFLVRTGQPSGVLAQGPLEPGMCPRPLENCLTFTVNGDLAVSGMVRGGQPGLAPQVVVPVVDGQGRPAGSRTLPCLPADGATRSPCDARLPGAGQRPQLGGIVQLLGQASVPTATATPTARSGGIVAPPPVGPALLLGPGLPPPLLPPLPGAVAPAGEVPVIPEASTAGLLVAGLAALAVLARGWR